MYRSKFKNLQILILWFLVNLLVSVAYTLMERANSLELKVKHPRKEEEL